MRLRFQRLVPSRTGIVAELLSGMASGALSDRSVMPGDHAFFNATQAVCLVLLGFWLTTNFDSLRQLLAALR